MCRSATKPTVRFPAAIACLALALTACAGRPAAPERAASPAYGDSPVLWSGDFDAEILEVGLHLGGSAPLESAAPIFDSGLRFAGLERRVHYSAGYQLAPGELLDPEAAQRWRGNALPQTVGSQILRQRLQVELDELFGAPLTLGAEHQQQDALLLVGARESTRQVMDLRWTPAFAVVHLNWQPSGGPVDSTQALQCDRSGLISVPLAAPEEARGRSLSIDARTRFCRVAAAQPGLAQLTANTWSTGVRWGRSNRETAVHVQGVTPGPGANVIRSDRPLTSGSGYELSLTQLRQLGDWQAKAGLAWRRPPEAQRRYLELQRSPWATSAELQRRLGAASVAASWRRGDIYWFLPSASAPADIFALSVDFAPWAIEVLGRYTPSMAMSYSWVRSDDALREDQQSLNWNLSFPWR